jgi:hypothetical protein
MRNCGNCRWRPVGLERYVFFKCPRELVMAVDDRDRSFSECWEASKEAK